jgi:hypothetical protein
MLHSLEQPQARINSIDISKVESIALVMLLGFELSYYLLIVQTGITQYFNSDLIALFPLFVGGVAGTIFAGQTWGAISNPIHKIIFALTLQLALSFTYPNFNAFTLGILGLSVGMMAPLSIYIFKEKQRFELFFALAIAYGVGTYFFTSFAESRGMMAVMFTSIALSSAVLLKDYKIQEDKILQSRSFVMYLPLMLWIFVDSNLFETISRSQSMDIWSNQTYTIIIFHIIGLASAFFIKVKELHQHFIVGVLFALSYLFAYSNMPIALAMIYPFVISYYNVIVFSALTKEMSLAKLSVMMVFIAWIASGIGLALALSKILAL